MKLTTFTDYSLRVLIYVAADPLRRPTIAEIATAFQISENHLTKVVHFLGRSGWLVTTRGKGGGLGLAMPPEAIGVGQVVRSTEGPDLPAECFGEDGGRCAIVPACRLRDVLGEAVAAFHGVLDRYSLADLVHTTFFDCDAICYEIGKKRLHALPGYLERINKRFIDVNLLPNPSIDGNLLRTSRRILLWGFQPGPDLQGFIGRELNEHSFARIVEIESLLYPNSVLGHFASAPGLCEALLNDRASKMFPNFGEQLDFPGFDAE